MQDKKYQGTVFGEPLNVRYDSPSVKAKRRDHPLQPGDKVTVLDRVYGGVYRGNDEWYRLEDGTYVWSGCVSLAEKPPIVRKPILFTADDYGVVEEIDIGIREAVGKGLINSVEVIPNSGDTEAKVKLLLEAADTGFKNGGFNLGIHFTISSGSPILEESKKSDMVDAKNRDFFKEFTEIGPLNAADTNKLKKELEAQVAKFGAYATRINHATSHHDTLTFHESHFTTLLQLCGHHGWSIRNYRFDPGIKRIMLEGLADDAWLTVHQLDKLRSAFNQSNPNGPVYTNDITYVDHFVVKAQLFDLGEKGIEKKAKKKSDQLSSIMLQHHHSASLYTGEVVFHLIEDKLRSKSEYLELIDDQVYPGLKAKYFDGRQVEIKSLVKFGKVEDSKYVQWGSYDDCEA